MGRTKKTGNRQGRPSKYTQELADKFYECLRKGMSITKICQKVKGMPTVSTITNWMDKDASFLAGYYKAKQIGAEVDAGNIIDITDNCKALSSADVAKAKLQVDTRKWVVARMLPKVYGDNLNINHTGEVKQIVESSQLAEIANNIRGQLEGNTGEDVVEVAPLGSGVSPPLLLDGNGSVG